MFKYEPASGEGRVDAVLMFNKLNGMYISAINLAPEEYCNIDTTFYTYRIAKFDFVNDVVEGQLTLQEDGTFSDDFKVIDKSEQKQVVNELQLNTAAEYKITKRYPVIEQVNVLSRAISKLAEQLGVELTELDEMNDYIKLCLDVNAAQKEFYRESPDVIYITDEERIESESRRFEGGLHEAVGPRTLTGGTIFKTGSLQNR